MRRLTSGKGTFVDFCVATLTFVFVAGCSVQLTAPYSEDIDSEASSLQADFVRFVADTQMKAGTADAFYDKSQQKYADFEARLAVIQMRSASIPRGVPCGRAVASAQHMERALTGPMQSEVLGRISNAGSENASCITILAVIASEQMERLRGQHQLRCNSSAPPARCTTLFSSPPIFGVILTGQSDAPLVSAVSISLNELVGAERDIKPLPKT
jgi:hypothetical protein